MKRYSSVIENSQKIGLNKSDCAPSGKYKIKIIEYEIQNDNYMAKTYRKPVSDSIFKSLNSIDQNSNVNASTNSKNSAFKNYTKIKLPLNFKHSLPSQSNNISTSKNNFSKEVMVTEKKSISSPVQANRVSSACSVKDKDINGFNTNSSNLISLNINNNNITNLRKYVHQVRNNKHFYKPSNSTTSNMKTTSMSNNQ